MMHTPTLYDCTQIEHKSKEPQSRILTAAVCPPPIYDNTEKEAISKTPFLCFYTYELPFPQLSIFYDFFWFGNTHLRVIFYLLHPSERGSASSFFADYTKQ